MSFQAEEEPDWFLCLWVPPTPPKQPTATAKKTECSSFKLLQRWSDSIRGRWLLVVDGRGAWVLAVPVYFCRPQKVTLRSPLRQLTQSHEERQENWKGVCSRPDYKAPELKRLFPSRSIQTLILKAQAHTHPMGKLPSVVDSIFMSFCEVFVGHRVPLTREFCRKSFPPLYQLVSAKMFLQISFLRIDKPHGNLESCYYQHMACRNCNQA